MTSHPPKLDLYIHRKLTNIEKKTQRMESLIKLKEDYKRFQNPKLKMAQDLILKSETYLDKQQILAATVLLQKANHLLDRKWEIIGKVIKGSQRGRKIGFPTCNILLKKYVIPKFGVYAVNVGINNILKKGIANIGYRPTFNGKKLLLEVNIFGIKKNLYNKKINVIFNKFIRPEKKFKNILELKNQIRKDIKLAK